MSKPASKVIVQSMVQVVYHIASIGILSYKFERYTALYVVGLYISFIFKQYDTYHDTNELIFNMYQQYILSCFRPKNLICLQISWDFVNCNAQIA